MSAVKSENGTLVTGAGGAKRKKDPLSQATNFAKKVLPKKKISKKTTPKNTRKDPISQATNFAKKVLPKKKITKRKSGIGRK